MDFCFHYIGKRCNVPLGMQNRRISNARITASSTWSKIYSPQMGRLHSPKSWCSKVKDHYRQWLQIDLGRPSRVTKIATQGRKDARQWVKRYTLSYSQDGAVFTEYKAPNSYTKRVGILLCFLMK